MATNRYIGARYVPLFTGEWDNTQTYEPLSVVTYQGDSYTSKAYVPTGVAITNTSYWIKTFDYNQQFAVLQDSVDGLAGDVEDLQTVVASFTKELKTSGDHSLAAGTTDNGSFSIAKTGYTPIAMAGYVLTGTSPLSDFSISSLAVGSSTCGFEISNTGDSTKTYNISVSVLYVKNLVE